MLFQQNITSIGYIIDFFLRKLKSSLIYFILLYQIGEIISACVAIRKCRFH